MSLRLYGMLAAFLALFALAILALLQANASKPSKPIKVDNPVNFSGTLLIRRIDDLTVSATHVILCGASFTKPRGMVELVSESARSQFPPQMVTCRQVGLGTPCDGLTAPRLNTAIVAQCFTKDGADLAEQLISQGFLCGQPDKSGGHYKAC